MRARRARRGPVRAALAAALVIDLAVLGVDVFLLNNVASTTVVGLDDALVHFRQSAQGAQAPVTPVPSAGGTGVTAPTAPADGSATTVAAAAPADGPVAGASPAAPAPFSPPAEGVYQYRTSGGEQISILGAHHDYPPITYASVRHDGGCRWTMHAAVVAEHVDERKLCSEAGQLLQLVQSRQVEFFGQRDGSTFTCTPPQVQHHDGDQPGASTTVDCGDGGSMSARLVRTTKGDGTVPLDGVQVPVVRFRIDGTMTGRARGSSIDLLTVVASTGLPVSWERWVDTVADAWGGTVRYQEHVSFDLVSQVPAT